MDYERRQIEEQIISHYIPNPKAHEWGGIGTIRPYVRIAARTNNGKVYVLRIELPNYPNTKPDAYVECMLKDNTGKLMNVPSTVNHTLKAHPNNWTQICHYHPDAWKPEMTIWMVYVRCVMWLNIYEQTLKTGNSMEYYLQHMGGDYHNTHTW